MPVNLGRLIVGLSTAYGHRIKERFAIVVQNSRSVATTFRIASPRLVGLRLGDTTPRLLRLISQYTPCKARCSSQMAASSSTRGNIDLLSRLSLALTRISQTTPRTIASPVTQPRRASVAILIRVKPHESDDEWLSEQYDADGQPLPGSEAERIMCQSGLGLGTNVDEKIDIPQQGRRGVVESYTSTGDISFSSNDDVSLLGISGLQAGETSSSSAVDLAGISTGDVQKDVKSPLKERRASSSSSSNSSPETLSPISQRGSNSTPSSFSDSTHLTLQRFFSLPWVQRGQPEILYIKRASRMSDKWSSHVAFPGGRKEEEDENGLYTAMRETWEEIGLDLAEKEFVNVGKLDDREITTSLGKRLLMVLSPYGEYPVPYIQRQPC